MTLVASLAEFKKHINYAGSGTTDDTELTIHLTSASDWAEETIGGPLTVTPYTELTEMQSGRFFPKRRPLVSVTSITPELGSDLDPGSYVVDVDRHLVRMLYTWGWPCTWYTIVYTAGLSTIPERVKLAGLIVAAHLWQTQNGGGGLPVPGDVNSNESVMFSSSLGFAIPNRARDLLQSYRLPRVH